LSTSLKWEKTTQSDARKKLENDQAIAVLVINKGFTEKLQKNVYNTTFAWLVKQKSLELQKIEPMVKGAFIQFAEIYRSLEKVPDRDGLIKEVIAQLQKEKKVEVKKQIIGLTKEDQQQKTMDRTVVGFSIMFLMFNLLFSAGVILEEKQAGTWGRLMVSPLTKVQLILGYFLAFFLLGWFQFAVLMLAGSLLFGVAWGNLLGIISFLSILILCFVGLGIMLATLVQTTQQQIVLGSMVIVITSMLGGIYWPLEVVSDWLQLVAKIVPQSWALDGLQLLMSGAAITQVALPLAVLGGFALVFFGVGLSRLKYS
jgi:ABC-2 type transport system permease protein